MTTRPNFQLCPTFLTLHCTLTNLNILIVYVLNFTHLGFEVKFLRSFYRPSADLPFLGLDPGDAVGGLTTEIHNMHGQRDAGPPVTFPSAEPNRPLDGVKFMLGDRSTRARTVAYPRSIK